MHCNEWAGWAEQDRFHGGERPGIVSFFIVFFPHTVVTFLFLLSRSPPVSPLVAKRLVPRTARTWKRIWLFIAQKDHISFGGVGFGQDGCLALKAQRWRLLWISLGSRVFSSFASSSNT